MQQEFTNCYDDLIESAYLRIKKAWQIKLHSIKVCTLAKEKRRKEKAEQRKKHDSFESFSISSVDSSEDEHHAHEHQPVNNQHSISENKKRHNHFNVKIFNLDKIDESDEISLNSDDSSHVSEMINEYKENRSKTKLKDMLNDEETPDLQKSDTYQKLGQGVKKDKMNKKLVVNDNSVLKSATRRMTSFFQKDDNNDEFFEDNQSNPKLQKMDTSKSRVEQKKLVHKESLLAQEKLVSKKTDQAQQNEQGAKILKNLQNTIRTKVMTKNMGLLSKLNSQHVPQLSNLNSSTLPPISQIGEHLTSIPESTDIHKNLIQAFSIPSKELPSEHVGAATHVPEVTTNIHSQLSQIPQLVEMISSLAKSHHDQMKKQNEQFSQF